MYNGKFISLKEILWQVYQHPLTDDLNYEDAAEYAVDGIKLIGAPLSYIESTTPHITITNYKAAIPANIISIRGVKLLNGSGESIALTKATDIYHSSIACEDTGPSINNDDNTFPTNPYNESNQGVNADIVSSNCGGSDGGRLQEFTYVAQNGVIQTSFRDGKIIIAYYGLACDEEGYPLIPDNIQVKECLRYYILFRFLEPLWIAGKVTDKAFEYINQKKCFYMGSANTSMQLQGIDHLETVMNAVNRLLVNDKAFSNFYKGNGLRERIKRYH